MEHFVGQYLEVQGNARRERVSYHQCAVGRSCLGLSYVPLFGVNGDLLTYQLTRRDVRRRQVESPHRLTNVARVAQSNTIIGAARADFEQDFVESPPTNVRQYVECLPVWRDWYERALEERPRNFRIEYINAYLAAFQFAELREIEVPGQYLQRVDSPVMFVKTNNVASKFRLCGAAGCSSTGSSSWDMTARRTFSYPVQRYWRREERVQEIFRTFHHVRTIPSYFPFC